MYVGRHKKNMATETNRYSDFDRLMQRHKALIRRLCWWQASGHREDCEDLMQDCLAALWHYRHTLRPDANERQERLWVKYHCRSVFSHLNARHSIDTTSLDEARTIAEETVDKRALINSLATTLTEYEHRVLDLILDGYTTAEIAATMGIKAASISQTRYRIIEKMKNQTTSES